MKKISDLLALSLFGISVYLITNISGFLQKFGMFVGLIGATAGVISQGYVLYEKWIRRRI